MAALFLAAFADGVALFQLGKEIVRTVVKLPGVLPWFDGVSESDAKGQGVPFTVVSSAAHAVGRPSARPQRLAGSGSSTWSTPVARARGKAPRFAVRVTELAGRRDRVLLAPFDGDMHSFMLMMKAWVAAAAGERIDEPIIVEGRVAYLNEHLPPGRRQGAGSASSRIRRLRTAHAVFPFRVAKKPNGESLLRGRRDSPHARRLRDEHAPQHERRSLCLNISKERKRIDAVRDRVGAWPGLADARDGGDSKKSFASLRRTSCNTSSNASTRCSSGSGRSEGRRHPAIDRALRIMERRAAYLCIDAPKKGAVVDSARGSSATAPATR